ncbi:hypothetical protein CERZMDRAFT_92192 [Cercospora zeae-maydis SCOH1-5]|uniref:AAA+ ATPase domain-containing protein n=1 Tax=Cercospora zeae-maydis SCOH1-5 TaxID=717836 RepID=A0A6A6FVN8_9PEZI|nr:hypothetical protein CERZMDRAFT_92192 [Cercospora zeae-maydis SCOH1-5]
MGLRQRQIPRENLTIEEIISDMQPLLQIQPNKRLVIMLCGPPGSGKTALGQAIVAQSPVLWELVSLERVIAQYDNQYTGAHIVPPPGQQQHRTRFRAEAGFRMRLLAWLDRIQPGRGLLLDDRFSRRAERDEFRAVIKEGGAEVQLVFLDFEKEQLWDRIGRRPGHATRDMLPGWVMDRATFEDSWKAFDRPRNEDEHIVRGR